VIDVGDRRQAQQWRCTTLPPAAHLVRGGRHVSLPTATQERIGW